MHVPLLVAALLTTQAVATIAIRDSLDSFVQLSKRQSSINTDQIPPECKPTCQPLVENIEALQRCGATDTKCLCTNEVNLGIQSCFNCLLNLVPDPESSRQAQGVLKDYEDECAVLGVPLPSLTIGAGTVSIPANTGTLSRSVFFSSSPTSPPVSTSTNTNAGGSSITRTTFGPGNTPTSILPAPSGSSDTSKSGALGSYAAMTGVLVAGAVGGVVVALML